MPTTQAEFLPFPPLTTSELNQLSPAALAYLGDAVYELYVRRHFLTPAKRPQIYHHVVVSQVRAERQAAHLQDLMPHLIPEEVEWIKRGRNAAKLRSRRMDLALYQQATGLETLIGFLYLTDAQRLIQLLAYLNLDTCSDRST